MPSTNVRPIEIAIEPKSPADRDRLLNTLTDVVAADPEHAFHIDVESGAIILEGISELGLDRLLGQIIEKVPILIGNPRVAYRETVTREATVDYTHRKRSGPSPQFARVKLSVRPDVLSLGAQIENRLATRTLTEDQLSAVEEGILGVANAGPVIGFPVQKVSVVLLEATSHETESSRIAFEIAARAAMRDALIKAGPKLLEPVMIVEIMTPAEFVTAITRDLKLRRAIFLPGEASTPLSRITAQVPLANMFGFASSLRRLSPSATWTMAFSHYAPLPPTDRGPDTFGPAVGMRG